MIGYLFLIDSPSRNILHASSPAVSDSHCIAVYDYRHLSLAVRQLEHLIHVFVACFNIEILVLPVSLPGPVRVRSSGFAVNFYFFSHLKLLSSVSGLRLESKI